eukprot:COSAG04_NODE_30361_length_263_cov_0.628049_1_plen_37_part_10
MNVTRDLVHDTNFHGISRLDVPQVPAQTWRVANPAVP